MRLKERLYFTKYAFETLVLRQKKPIIAGIPLTDICNLQCKHCVVANVGGRDYSFAKIEQLLRHFYNIGARIVYLQGGEIMTWHEGPMDVNDVIRRAHEIGFFKVAAVTNGTMGIPMEADLVWVSLDGAEEVHDAIRGPGTFTRVMYHLEKSQHKHVNLNMTINCLNAKEVDAVAAIARGLPTLKGVSYNFHTPYPGVEDILLPIEEREIVIDRILRLKRDGFPVLNTVAGLKALRKNKYRRPIPLIHLVEKNRVFECCWGRDYPGVCERCGYGIIAELSQVLSWNLPAMVQAISLFD